MTVNLNVEGAPARWAEGRLSATDLAGLGPTPRLAGSQGPLPMQIDLRADGSAEIVARLDGAEGPLTLAPGEAASHAEVMVDTIEAWEEQESFRVQTATGTWIYHKHGAGFASLIDPEGRDWLSFRPWGGSDGIYRGIPNLAYPENVYHPGHPTCVTRMRAGPLRVTFDSRSKDDVWACRWHIYRDHAELTVLEVGHPYWLLYEGTPAGKLEEDRDYCIVSDGRRRLLSEKWAEVLPQPKWIAFGKEGEARALWLWSHSPENAECRDSFYPMESNMTVFGFGRDGMEKFMTHVPSRFTLGLTEAQGSDLPAEIDACGARARLVLAK